MADPLPQGACIGILGGGQLGRMLSVAAARLGFICHIFEPGTAPAGHVADRVTTAGYDDAEALVAFAETVDVVTYEFENIPSAALDLLESVVPIHPNRTALATSQDRLTEKQFLTGLGLGVAPFAPVDDEASLATAIDELGFPAILKTRRFGYDGKGQARISSTDDARPGLESLAGAPAVLEGFVSFEREISVIAGRSLHGEVVCFEPGENVHVDGILRSTTVPAAVSERVRAEALLVSEQILEALDYVGVLGVELFVTDRGLLVNEFAPRVHNSGHWTQNGCAVDQFEQHVRAITGLPLGDGARHADVRMENLIHDDLDRLDELLRTPKTAVHLYGKAESRPGRKMGHVNSIVALRSA